MPSWVTLIIDQDELNLTPEPGKSQYQPPAMDKLVEVHDGHIAKARESLLKTNDDYLVTTKLAAPRRRQGRHGAAAAHRPSRDDQPPRAPPRTIDGVSAHVRSEGPVDLRTDRRRSSVRLKPLLRASAVAGMTRRELMAGVAGLAAMAAPRHADSLERQPAAPRRVIQTVTGPLAPERLGLTLMHEHVLVDFIGADQVSPSRYDADAGVPRASSRTSAGSRAGVRDPGRMHARVPRPRSGAAAAAVGRVGRPILTNTGYYGAAKDKHLPPHAFTETRRPTGGTLDRRVRAGHRRHRHPTGVHEDWRRRVAALGGRREAGSRRRDCVAGDRPRRSRRIRRPAPPRWRRSI